jgi:hypothetical protein
VRVQLVADACAVWLEGQGLPATDAQVVGGLAAHGVAVDADGDVTVAAFDEFTAGMGISSPRIAVARRVIHAPSCIFP